MSFGTGATLECIRMLLGRMNLPQFHLCGHPYGVLQSESSGNPSRSPVNPVSTLCVLEQELVLARGTSRRDPACRTEDRRQIGLEADANCPTPRSLQGSIHSGSGA
ncbi:unnamed protein product, partial [Iphiclides podalirius]